MLNRKLLVGMLGAALSAPLVASAGTPTLPDDLAHVAVLPGWREADGRTFAGLAITLAPGWKTYWRAPGEAGIPPVFDWSGSRNLTSVRVHWPTPHIFELNGMTTIGYKDAVVLPVEVVPTDTRRPISLSAAIEFGVCNEVCVPVSAQFTAELPSEGTGDPRVETALRSQPVPAGGPAPCRIDPIADGVRLTADLPAQPADGRDFVVVETPDPTIWISEATVSRAGDHLTATADLVPPSGSPFALERGTIRFTVFSGDTAREIVGCTSG